MMNYNSDFAIKTAIELAKSNIESTDRWITPEEVNYFVEQVFSFLTDERETNE